MSSGLRQLTYDIKYMGLPDDAVDVGGNRSRGGRGRVGTAASVGSRFRPAAVRVY